MLRRTITSLRLLLATAVAATGLLVMLPTASAECELVWSELPNGEMGWVEECSDSGGDDGEDTGGDNGDGGEQEPTCDLSQVEGEGPPTAVQWCMGTEACWGNIPSLNPPEDWEQLAGEPSPGEGYIVTFVVCYPSNPGGTWQWILPPEEQGPSLWDLAWQAFGNIATPDFTLAFSPPDRSFVNLDTWYWAEGPSDGEIIGESTGAVNAIATPDRIEVDPGDGSGVLQCPFTVAESDACSHVYAEASVDHPDGYPARMRLVYDISFTNNGDPLELDGLPTTLESPWVDGPLPVAEAQSIVVE
ncbi:hypothetical protein E1262_04330 [Jiangella aurantiaca]|uniref:Uncharacterized protein n=1 Tax=Jiangella aurantiaca TaxID=2530373 RepID=A0A4R5AHK9_9ACTN|nr:hypothetical protein [Jiangella aurantiaca]TDD71961.1 hypothetical protein E1262_04330 [Jiangella aurantiaca]